METVRELDAVAGRVLDGPLDTAVHGVAGVPAAPPVEARVDAAVVLDLVGPAVDQERPQPLVRLGPAGRVLPVAVPERPRPAAVQVHGALERVAPALLLLPGTGELPIVLWLATTAWYIRLSCAVRFVSLSRL